MTELDFKIKYEQEKKIFQAWGNFVLKEITLYLRRIEF